MTKISLVKPELIFEDNIKVIKDHISGLWEQPEKVSILHPQILQCCKMFEVVTRENIHRTSLCNLKDVNLVKYLLLWSRSNVVKSYFIIFTITIVII